MRPEGPNWLATSPLNHLSIIPKRAIFMSGRPQFHYTALFIHAGNVS